MGTIVRYFEGFHQDDTSVPCKEALKSLGRILDGSAERVVTDLTDILNDSPEHQRRVHLLKGLPTTSGKFEHSKCRFAGVSSFEQTAALESWLAETKIIKLHTLFLATGEDDYIPVKVSKYAGVRSNLMHVCLGATNGTHKAPKYTDWAINDPSENAEQKIFMQPLENLEILRQPGFAAATVIKGDAYDTDQIGSDWRYGSEYACVEDKGQSKKGVPKETAKKLMSAGLNLTTLVDVCADADDPQAKDVDICPPLHYEDFADEGYADYADFAISPGALVEAAEEAIVHRNNHDLDRLMQNLVFARLGIPTTPTVRAHIAQRLRANQVED